MDYLLNLKQILIIVIYFDLLFYVFYVFNFYLKNLFIIQT